MFHAERHLSGGTVDLTDLHAHQTGQGGIERPALLLPMRCRATTAPGGTAPSVSDPGNAP
jgi:hypothetical protein